LKNWLRSIDLNGDGVIDKPELQIACTNSGLALNDEELDLVFPILDADGSGSFDLDELFSFVQVATRTNFLQQRIVTETGARPGSNAFKQCKDAIMKVLTMVPGREELKGLVKTFDIISDVSGSIDKEAIQNALHRFDCAFTDDEGDLVFSVMDLNSDGDIDISEFSEFIKACSTTQQRIAAGSNSDPGSARFLDATVVVNKILSVIPGSEMSMMVDTFRTIDSDHSGSWSEAELVEAMFMPEFTQRITQAGLADLTKIEIKTIYQILDVNNHGAVDMDTFVDFFQMAQSLDMALAFDKGSTTGGTNHKLGDSFKKAINKTQNVLFTMSAAKADKELKISTTISRVYKNELSLQVLTMTGQDLKDPHMKSLIHALDKNTNVRALHLQYNDITDKGAIALAALIESGRGNISSINLANNHISTIGIEALQMAAKTKSTTFQLRFKGNPGYNERCLTDAFGVLNVSSF